jgi:hypothetical protein
LDHVRAVASTGLTPRSHAFVMAGLMQAWLG